MTIQKTDSGVSLYLIFHYNNPLSYCSFFLQRNSFKRGGNIKRDRVSNDKIYNGSNAARGVYKKWIY